MAKVFKWVALWVVAVSCSPGKTGFDGYEEIKIEMPPALRPDSYPMYKNGRQGINAYFSDKLVAVELPDTAFDRKVIVAFIVSYDGSIEEPRIIKGIGSNQYLNKLVLDAVGKMTDWKPAKKRGKKIDFYYQLPIQF